MAAALRCLVLLATLGWGAQASAQSIRVQGECGFGFVPCELPLTTFTMGAAPLPYFDLGEGSIFTLQYATGDFVITALRDNSVGPESLPFGLDIYPATGPLRPPIDAGPCDETVPVCYQTTSLGFIAMFRFPTVAGTSYALAVPTAAVPEPGTATLLASGLLVGGVFARRRRGSR